MNRRVVKAKVDGDGVLRLELPMGAEDANKEVDVTVEPVPARRAMTPEQWHAWVDAMAGSWTGDFERMPQGEYEERDLLS